MKITLYRKTGKDLSVPMPLSALATKSFWKLLNLEDRISDDYHQQMIRQMVDVLGRYRKKNGSFTLVDARDSEGGGIKIVI